LLRELPAEKNGPLVVKLQPCGSISGRIVDEDGQPVAGRYAGLGPGKDPYDPVQHVFTTDKEGRFRVEGLVPGLGYWLFQTRFRARWLDAPLTVVEPGKNKDLGDIKKLAGLDGK
jgi:hypothetical protein